MAKKFKVAVILLAVYLAVFAVGFKSGSIYVRMKKKVDVERVEIPRPPAPPPLSDAFYIIERTDFGNYTKVTFERGMKDDVIIDMFLNEKLRPLLKARNLEIYNQEGERVY